MWFGIPDSIVAGMGSLKDGFIWDVAAGSPDQNNGHCIGSCGYNPTAIMAVATSAQGLLVETWGMLGVVTWAALAAWFVPSQGGGLATRVSMDWVNSSGQTPAGLDEAAMIAAFNQYFGGSLPVPRARAGSSCACAGHWRHPRAGASLGRCRTAGGLALVVKRYAELLVGRNGQAPSIAVVVALQRGWRIWQRLPSEAPSSRRYASPTIAVGTRGTSRADWLTASCVESDACMIARLPPSRSHALMSPEDDEPDAGRADHGAQGGLQERPGAVSVPLEGRGAWSSTRSCAWSIRRRPSSAPWSRASGAAACAHASPISADVAAGARHDPRGRRDARASRA